MRAFWYGETAAKSYWSVADRLVVSGVNFLTIVIVGRAAGLSDLGVFALAWTILLAAMVIQEAFIVSPFTVNDSRFKRAADRKRYLGAVIIQQVGLLAAATLLIVVGAFLTTVLGTDVTIRDTAWGLAFAAPAFLAREFARRFYLARLIVDRLLLLDVASALLQLSLLAGLWFTGILNPATALLAIGLASALPAIFWLATNLQAFVLPDRAVLATQTAAHWQYGRWVGLAQMSDIATSHGIAWLVAALAGTAATGLFAACNSLLMVANPLVFGIGSILLPRVAQANSSSGAQEVRRIVIKGALVIMVSAGAVCLAVAALGNVLINLLYSFDTAQGVTLVVFLLALANTVGAAGMALDSGLLVINRPDMNAVASVLGLVATVAMGWTLVPDHLAMGAASGVLAGSIVATLIRAWAFFRLCKPKVVGGRN